MFANKKILVTGGTGMIGSELIELLKEHNPAEITSVSMDDRKLEGIQCLKADLTEFSTAKQLCRGKDFVFHLAGIKGSPDMTKTRPANFLVPMSQFNANVLEAARQADVEWLLYTSSVGVYAPADVFKEDSVWDTVPSKYDLHAGYTKRIAELQLDAYKIQYGFDRFSIIRPANVYGRRDNFNPKTSMVIPALIARICSGENPLTVWGTGLALRDFVNAHDVARAMLFAVENKISEPLNIGSGEGILIKDLVETVVECYRLTMGEIVNVVWDDTKPTGDRVRIMDMSRLFGYGYKNTISLHQGIMEAMDYYLQNKEEIEKRYDVFTK